MLFLLCTLVSLDARGTHLHRDLFDPLGEVSSAHRYLRRGVPMVGRTRSIPVRPRNAFHRRLEATRHPTHESGRKRATNRSKERDKARRRSREAGRIGMASTAGPGGALAPQIFVKLQCGDEYPAKCTNIRCVSMHRNEVVGRSSRRNVDDSLRMASHEGWEPTRS